MEEDFEEDSEDDFAEDDQDSEYDPEDEDEFGEDFEEDFEGDFEENDGTEYDMDTPDEDDYDEDDSALSSMDEEETVQTMDDEISLEDGDSPNDNTNNTYNQTGEEDGEESGREAGQEDGEESGREAGQEDLEENGQEAGQGAGEGTGQEAPEENENGAEDENTAGAPLEEAEAGTDAAEKAAQKDAEDADSASEDKKDDDASSKDAESADDASKDAKDAGSTSADAAAAEKTEKSYMPELDPLNFEAVLNRSTGIYYYHVSEDETIENSSAITDWNRVEKDTELGKRDLLRVYLSYTIPPGSLNETNSTARYRLPENIRLSDAQIEAINKSENGIAAAYSDSEEDYQKYLGMEAVEGGRKPDEKLQDGAQEFISATVRAENIYDEEDKDGEAGTYQGQELIFTFAPYSIEKNRNTYDSDHKIVSAGEEITGWFVCDLNTDQVEWSDETVIRETEPSEDAAEELSEDNSEDDQETPEDVKEDSRNKQDQNAPEDIREKSQDDQDASEENQKDSRDGQDAPEDIQDNSEPVQENEEDGPEEAGINTGDDSDGDHTDRITITVEKTAEIIFAAEDKEDDIKEISSRLRLVEQTEADRETGLDEDPDGKNEEDAATFAEDAEGAASEEEKSEDNADTERDAAKDAAAAEKDAGDASSDAEKDGAKNTDDDKGKEAEDRQAFKAGRLTAEGDGYKITLDYTEKAKIPENAELAVREITAETDKEAYEQCLAQARAHIGKDAEEKAGVDTNMTRFFDIEILAENVEPDEKETEGSAAIDKIEPAAPVKVSIQIFDTPDTVSGQMQQTDPTVLHFAEDGVEQIDATAATEEAAAGTGGRADDPERKESRETEPDRKSGKENGEESGSDKEPPAISGTAPEGGKTTEIQFEAESFSIYGVVYTVDFHYEVNGKTYDFSIPGGGFVTLQHLVEALGIADGDTQGDAVSGGHYEEAVNLNKAAVSEKTREFTADVESVEFSNSELVWVGKDDEKRTVGQIKNANGLEVQYSAELKEEQIEEINAQTVEAGDWALISMQPFTSEEKLTVTMKTGEVFTIRVTDAQISTNVLTADGMSFKITVTYDEEARLPEGTKLEANEIEADTDEYLQYLGRTWSEVNKTYEAAKGAEEDSDARSVNVNMARFFDIKLLYQGKEVKPKAPVHVEITYIDGLLSWDGTKPGVVNFKQNGEIEILEKVETDIEDGAAVSFCYDQDAFSVIGTYIQEETFDAVTPPRGAEFTSSYSRASAEKRSSADLDGNGDGEEYVENPALAIAPVELRAGSETESPADQDTSDLPRPESHKSLEPNEDGTYTLTLSVKGSSQTTIQKNQKKANVLFVMDRSSSMITNTVDNEDKFWYYGTKNTAEFRQDIGDPNHATGKLYQFWGVVNGEYVQLNTNFTDWSHANFTYWDGTYDYIYGNLSKHYVSYPDDAPLYVQSKTTRLYAEQHALDDVMGRLLAYNTSEEPDNVEIAVISFAIHRADTMGWTDTEHADWTQGADKTDLMNAVNQTRYASGTNWEEALKYAYDVISDKKSSESNKPEEEYYVVFLTDGEPTNMVGDTSSAQHTGDAGNKDAYDAAKDDALKLVQEGYEFYNIFTYRKGEPVKYSKYLTNYAYSEGQSDYNESPTEALNTYFSDAQTIEQLNDTFDNIFQTIADVIGHADVSITDTLTTDAMTTTIVQGKTNGYVYTVKNPSGTVLYTVTATGDIGNPTVSFHVPASATKDYIATPTEVGDKTLYSVTTAEGDEYRMALADVNSTTGELEWDLSPVGIVMNDCTYSVSFVVWPDQEAYDYVAGLNNGLPGYTWDTSTENEAYQDLTDTKGYEIGGVPRFPSIVKYADGTFAVLTNTDQKVHYSVVEMETVNGVPNGDPTIHGPYYQDLETPDPMELTSTETKLQKAWGIDRNPSTLAQLLYNDDGTPTQFQIEYGIKILDQGKTGTGSEGSGTGQEEPDDGQEGSDDGQEGSDDGQDQPSYYTTLTLGWDGTKYDWDPNSVRYVSLNGNSGPSVPVGTSWSKDFAIATGLMLSEARMDALGLDKVKYGPPYRYGSMNYFILETGHDYTIEEIIPEDAPRDAYEFDFDAPTYHPMLVDGKLKSVTFNRDEENNEIISIKEISKEDWLLSLKIENTLRGYIRLEKNIVDKDGRTPLPEDDTEFEYKIDIEDPLNPGRFTGTHIPWYGVDGLFYHNIDDNGNYHYFQAETNTPDRKAHEFTLTTESGEECPAVCIDAETEGIFNEDVVGPTLIQYVENGVTKEISLYGNQMEHIDDNHVHAVMKINQNQVLDIANVPSKSTYTIEEVNQEGYNLVNIRREIRNNNRVES